VTNLFQAVSTLLNILITFPIIGFVLVFVAVQWWKKDRKKSLVWAVNITNLLLIQAVAVSYEVIWPNAGSAWWLVLGLFGGLIVLLAWLQIRLRGRISLKRISFSAWRLSFLVFCLTYLFLFGTGVWKTLQLS